MGFNYQRIFTIGLIALMCVGWISADQAVCNEEDNPFYNIQFTAPVEAISEDKTVSIKPLVISYLQPSHIACEKNYNEELGGKLRLKCEHKPKKSTTICKLDGACEADRKRILASHKKIMIRNLEELVKKKAAEFFGTKYLVIKEMIFGDKPIKDFTGKEIVEKISCDCKTMDGEFLLKGFAISDEIEKFSGAEFDAVFQKPLALIKHLKRSKPKGGIKFECKVKDKNQKEYIVFKDKKLKKEAEETAISQAKSNCAPKFFKAWENKNKWKKMGARLHTTLVESIDYLLKEITGDDSKTFTDLKIPLRGACVEGNDFEYDTSISKDFGETKYPDADKQAVDEE